MKLLLVYLAPFITSTGGAEKVCCDMANAMIERGHLYTYDPADDLIEVDLGGRRNI